ncbi:hypothetical protein OUZ56_007077 [Daphnia magna]|uniref:Uncharacterized protein n=1 Tax=Daphnia magna TaxID=35525 RepID=A0ABQ9YXI5_9CRUS|nr:hypothetical protein OUZ56_007077 [Daphnia magna]
MCVDKTRDSLDQATQDVEQQTAVPVPGMSGTSNDTTVLNAGPSSHRNEELEDRAYVNPAMEE